MSVNNLVVAEHLAGALADITFEMIALAKARGGTTAVALVGGTDAMVAELGAADTIVRVAASADFNPDTHAAAVGAAIEAVQPALTLIGNTSMGMDLASTLSVNLGRPLACSVRALDGSKAIAQLYGGKLDVTTDLGDGPALVTVLAGSASADDGRGAGSPELVTVTAPPDPGRIRFLELVAPETADVDITVQDVLVAIGRGIGDKDGVEVAEELAEALDAAVAASRPIIDAGWLPKSRQVGKSGLKVKARVYVALGISGAPEHLEGIKGVGTLIAVNTDADAPIFGVADYGLVADLFEVCEELTEALE